MGGLGIGVMFFGLIVAGMGEATRRDRAAKIARGEAAPSPTVLYLVGAALVVAGFAILKGWLFRGGIT